MQTRSPAARSDHGLAEEVVYLNHGCGAQQRPHDGGRRRRTGLRATRTLDTLLILLGQAERTWHGLAMSESETNIHPYTLEVIPPKEEGGTYNWAIRKHGKLAQRSDRGYPTAAKAQAAGMATAEKLLSGSDR